MSNPPNKTDPNGPGFTIGVLLGAMVGTGATFILGTQKGRKFKEKFLEEAEREIDELKEQYPKQAEQIDDVLEKVLFEARSATDEIKDVAQKATKKAKKEAEKRLFIKSGKPLRKISSKK